MTEPLVPLADAPGSLELLKESWSKGVYDLRAPAGTVARLDRSIWSGRAKAEAADGSWAFGRSKGLLKATIAITDTRTGEAVGSFAQRTWTRGGAVELHGTEYRLDAAGIMRPRWTWSRDGRALVEVRKRPSLSEHKGEVELLDAGRGDRCAALLLLLAVHVILTDDDSTAAAAA